MIGALLTCLFWAFSAICGQRAARKLGSLRANIVRLLIALVVLGGLTFAIYPNSFHKETFWWLIVGGVLGFGIGDVALYLALARIGSRLTVLITFCVAPVFGVVGDWLAFGEGPTFVQAAAAVLMIEGVCFAMKPTSPLAERYGNPTFGLVCAFFAAAGQGLGAVFSRIAFKQAEALDLELPALSQAFHRILGGVVIAAIAIFVVIRAQRREGHPTGEWKFENIGWLLGATFCGPIVGLIFYQWALSTAPSWLVLVIISFIPILTIPLAWWLEGDRPTKRGITGAAIAVSGLILIGVLRN